MTRPHPEDAAIARLLRGFLQLDPAVWICQLGLSVECLGGLVTQRDSLFGHFRSLISLFQLSDVTQQRVKLFHVHHDLLSANGRNVRPP